MTIPQIPLGFTPLRLALNILHPLALYSGHGRKFTCSCKEQAHTSFKTCNGLSCACTKQETWWESNTNTALQCRNSRRHTSWCLGKASLRSTSHLCNMRLFIKKHNSITHTPVITLWPYQQGNVYHLWSFALTPGMAHSPQSLLLIATNCKMFLPVTGWAILLPLLSLFHLQQTTNKNMLCCFLTQRPGRGITRHPCCHLCKGKQSRENSHRQGGDRTNRCHLARLPPRAEHRVFHAPPPTVFSSAKRAETTQEPHFCSHADSSSSFESYVQHILPAVMLTKLHLCLSLTSMPSARTEHTCRLQHLRSTSPSTSTPPQTPTVVFCIELRRTANSQSKKLSNQRQNKSSIFFTFKETTQ